MLSVLILHSNLAKFRLHITYRPVVKYVRHFARGKISERFAERIWWYGLARFLEIGAEYWGVIYIATSSWVLLRCTFNLGECKPTARNYSGEAVNRLYLAMHHSPWIKNCAYISLYLICQLNLRATLFAISRFHPCFTSICRNRIF